MDISSANAQLTLSASPLFTSPVTIQQFGPDEIYGLNAVRMAELSFGADGQLSAGIVYEPFNQTITLMASSSSFTFFDQLAAYEFSNQIKLALTGTLTLKSIKTTVALVTGYLVTYSAAPAAGRILRPRTYEIGWQAWQPAPSATN